MTAAHRARDHRDKPVLPGQFIEPDDEVGGADDRPSGPHGHGRAWRFPPFDLITLAQGALVLPWILISLALLCAVAMRLPDPWGQRVLIAWLLAGACALLPAAEPLVARVCVRARPPTGEEVALLAPCWAEVAQKAQLRATSYRLRVRDDPEAASTPFGVHTLVITRWALTQLAPVQLEALLAQCLGRLRSGHAGLTTLTFWYALPARALRAVCLRVIGTGLRALAATSLMNCALAVFTLAVSLLIGLTLLLRTDQHLVQAVLLTPLLAPPVTAWLERLHVHRADRYAMHLGYGQPLLEVLAVRQQQEEMAHPVGALARLMTSTPTSASRIRNLERQIERLSP